ncbi:hypothetical protein, variant [Sphaeroforma arctica JP610]|uniref:PPM-type phosphatase domain-containing protein n=1 Tax=Sphaeroforma arctica JP610 TaxID=667725 RepID=A0A0L0G4I1_9EUKA|nr:hypothetical protein, variant [Sphaeroforma arctica JP610]KNC83123.1 hypothetical protein, variant [Sphaeroforma arctica JP610]|eukprot:XP_014157025.1 hypothetical protein, variant [Sphaeroforma arctica JP610]
MTEASHESANELGDHTAAPKATTTNASIENVDTHASGRAFTHNTLSDAHPHEKTGNADSEETDKVIEDRKRSIEIATSESALDSKRPRRERTSHFGLERIVGCRPFKYETYGFAAERRGERDTMQDAHTIMNDLWAEYGKARPLEAPRLAFYGVYDGHAGDRAAKYAAKHLHIHYLNNVAGYLEMKESGLIAEIGPKEQRKCITDAFKTTDTDFLKLAASQGWKDGTTAVVVILYDDYMLVANLGDSGAVLAKDIGTVETESSDYKALLVTKDHNPMVHTERMRIQKAGGSVTNGRINGILGVSRSIGDGAFKRLGLTCVPEIVAASLTGKEKLVIMGCDGLWGDLNRPDAVKFAGTYMRSEESLTVAKGILDRQELNFSDAELRERRVERPATLRRILVQSVVKALVNEAVRKGSTDNTSALVIGIGEVSQA